MERDLTDSFIKLKEHYCFNAVFCNRNAGNEKGHVENKVGYHRRNFLVPMPEFKNLAEYNKELLQRCERDLDRIHYRKERLSGNIVENIKKIEETDKELFLLRLFQLEIEHRRHNRRLRNVKNGGFYTLKGFDDYEFDDVKLPDALTVDAIIAGEFIQKKQNLIMYGNPGTGKTHLATAIGQTACRNDLKVGFFRPAGLFNKLLEAKRKNEFDKFLGKLARLDLIIAGEWGYVPLDKEGSQLLFHVISESYERKSLIITTNLEFSRWLNIFYDKDMTTAMVDRLVHHSHLLIFDGESWRMKNSLISH